MPQMEVCPAFSFAREQNLMTDAKHQEDNFMDHHSTHCIYLDFVGIACPACSGPMQSFQLSDKELSSHFKGLRDPLSHKGHVTPAKAPMWKSFAEDCHHSRHQLLEEMAQCCDAAFDLPMWLVLAVQPETEMGTLIWTNASSR